MKGHCPLAPTALLLPRPPATASPVAFAPSTQDNEGIRSTKSSFPTFDVRAQFASFLFFCRKNLPFLALRVIKETCFEDLRCHFSFFHLDEEGFFSISDGSQGVGCRDTGTRCWVAIYFFVCHTHARTSNMVSHALAHAP